MTFAPWASEISGPICTRLVHRVAEDDALGAGDQAVEEGGLGRRAATKTRVAFEQTWPAE